MRANLFLHSLASIHHWSSSPFTTILLSLNIIYFPVVVKKCMLSVLYTSSQMQQRCKKYFSKVQVHTSASVGKEFFFLMNRIKLIDLISTRKCVDYMIMQLLHSGMPVFITILCYPYNFCRVFCVSFMFSLLGGKLVTVTLLSLHTSIFGWGG